MPKIPWGAYIGMTAGVCGWVLGLVAATAAAGEVGLLLRVGLPSLVGSLAAAAAGIALLEQRRRLGMDRRARWCTVSGLVLVLVALFGTAISWWVMPALLRSDSVRRVLAATRSVTSLPWPLLAVCAVAGVALLVAGRPRR